MGSLEEEDLIQMVQDFIEQESQPAISFTSSETIPLNHQYTYLALQEILMNVKDAEVELFEKILKCLRNRRIAGSTSSLKNWLVMRLRMDGYDASLCKTSWDGTGGCPGGDYEYIDVVMKDKDTGGPMRLIVDIDFKSQFELARPTETYTELINTLPSIFVGREDRLNKIISLLCSAAKQSLKERGLHIPPWRRTSYMLSKWLSNCQKISVTPFLSSNREVGEVGKVSSEAKSGAHGPPKFNKWAPPIVKPKRNFSNGSGLSSQFSGMTINCC